MNNHSEVELIGALTKGSKADCLGRGNKLLIIDELLGNLEEQSLVDSAGDNAVMATYGNSLATVNSYMATSALAGT